MNECNTSGNGAIQKHLSVSYTADKKLSKSEEM